MRRILLALAVTLVAASACAQQMNKDEAAIRSVMMDQQVAWNRGDVSAFMQGYEDSPDTEFVGATSVGKGFQPILENYRKSYSSAAQMGKLTFSHLDVRLLPGSCNAVEYAVVTGNFHLDRKQKGAVAKDDGIFSLLWRKGPQGWKIIVDHTS